MLGLKLVVYCRQELLQGIELFGGATSSTVFPNAENLLHQTEYQEGLDYVSGCKNMDKYRSVMDFLFGEIMIEYRFHVFTYYNGRGPKLFDNEKDFPEEIIHYCDVKICLALEVAKEMNKQKLEKTWCGMIKRFEILSKAA